MPNAIGPALASGRRRANPTSFPELVVATGLVPLMIAVRLRRIVVGLLLLTSACGGEAETQVPEYRGTIAWVGLYTDDLLRWLENENRLMDICGQPTQPATDTWTRCATEARKPRSVTVTVYEAPSTDARALGSIEIVAVPAQGLTAQYLPETGDPVPFVPDIYLQDWGYGPFFHQSILTHTSGWVMLPPTPFPAPVWVNAQDAFGDGYLREPYREEIVSSPSGDW
jgi:hypothetical protein